jgi:hypothetical protein
MNGFALTLGIMIVCLAARPAFMKAQASLRHTQREMNELRRRQFALSQKIRSLARESLGQRLTAGQDDHESEVLQSRIDHVQQLIEQLEQEDRRILVLDERRGLSESGWIVCIRRRREVASPLEPDVITNLWDEGRFVFFFATDAMRAKRKAMVRFTEEAGFTIVEVRPHEGDLSDPPALGNNGAHAADKRQKTA